MPSKDAVSLITVLPEQLQSPLLTAEWEHRLSEIERGELSPEDFMGGICAMLRELVRTYQVIKGTEYLFTPPREVVGKCPRCGGDVAELQKGSSARQNPANLPSGKQQMVGSQEKAAYQGTGDSTAQGWPYKDHRLLFRKDRQDL